MAKKKKDKFKKLREEVKQIDEINNSIVDHLTLLCNRMLGEFRQNIDGAHVPRDLLFNGKRCVPRLRFKSSDFRV